MKCDFWVTEKAELYSTHQSWKKSDIVLKAKVRENPFLPVTQGTVYINHGLFHQSRVAPFPLLRNDML